MWVAPAHADVPPRREGPRGDDGLTLVELLVAMGMFGVLMAMISTGVLTGYSTLRDITAQSDVQAQQQTSLLWITRLLHYADNPVEGLTPLPWTIRNSGGTDANGNSYLTFYTYSGTGPKDKVPYKAELKVDASGDLVSIVSTPTSVGGYGWCWLKADAAACSAVPEDVRTRVLVPAKPGHTPSFTLTYLDSAGVATPPPANATEAAWKAWASAVAQVRVSIVDDSASQQVQQTVRLVNPR